MITGIVQTTKTNDYGYTSYKISSTWYGADSKGPPRASEGEKVSFEAFDKPGKEGRVFPTIKLATFKKVAAGDSGSTQQPVSGGAGDAATKARYSATSGASRDTYWADKEKSDKAKDPRIAYFAAFERAVAFADLAIRTESFPLKAAKATSKLEVLQAFVDEQTARIMQGSYAATVPTQEVAAPVNSATSKEGAGVAAFEPGSDEGDWE